MFVLSVLSLSLSHAFLLAIVRSLIFFVFCDFFPIFFAAAIVVVVVVVVFSFESMTP